MTTQALRRTLRTALAVAAMGAVLAGCGEAGPVKMGAAATLGGKRITIAQVKKAADEWRAEAREGGLSDSDLQRAAPQLARTMADPTSPERSVLYRLIDFAVVEEVAKARRVDVTEGQVDQYIAQAGGQKRLEVDSFRWGIPPSLTRAFAARDVRLSRIFDSLGVRDNSAAERQIRDLIVATMGRMRLSINPRYGALDRRDLVLSPACTTLSKGPQAALPPMLPGAPPEAAAAPGRPGCHPLSVPAPPEGH
jgi:hypothetical protein